MMPNNGYEKTIKYYDSIAGEYLKTDAAVVLKDKIELLINNIPIGGHIADIGCGPGHDTRYIAEKGFNMLGLDASNHMIEIAKQISNNIIFRVENVLDFNYIKLFDGIWCSSLFVHIEKKEINQILVKLYDGLKNNGILGIITASKQDIQRNPLDCRLYNMYTIDELVKIVNNVGFNIIESSTFEYGGRDRLFIIGKK